MKIILGGPPHSGKSCLRAGLKAAIRDAGQDYCYVITATPDGEGAWFHETAERDPNLAHRLKADYRSSFTEEFVANKAQQVANCTLPLTIVDIGGRVSDENRRICATATHAVLLARTPDDFVEWEAFCQELNIQVIARFISDYHGTEDTWQQKSKCLLEGSIHYLERGEDLSKRPAIAQLAQHILRLI